MFSIHQEGPATYPHACLCPGTYMRNVMDQAIAFLGQHASRY